MGSINRYLGILAVGAAATSLACSGSKTADNSNGTQPTYNPNATGVNGLPAADSTADGMLTITAAQGATITGGCGTWNQTPEGGGYAILEFIIDISGSMTGTRRTLTTETPVASGPCSRERCLASLTRFRPRLLSDPYTSTRRKVVAIHPATTMLVLLS